MDSERLATVDKFLVQQTFSPLVNRYRVSTIAHDGRSEGDEPLAFVEQKRLKIREQVDIFADEARQTLALRLKARKIFEFRGRTDVLLPDGEVIGQLQKLFKESLLVSSWAILDADGNEIARAREQSILVAVLRRVWGWIPVVGELPFLLPFHFDITIDGRKAGEYRRIWAIRDRYVMDLTGDVERRLDRRVAVAFAIALDALQDR